MGVLWRSVTRSGWVTPPTVSYDIYLKHPAHFIGLPVVGSMVLDVSSNRLEAKFLSAAGPVDDHFTLRKGVGPEPLRIPGVPLLVRAGPPRRGSNRCRAHAAAL